MILVKTFKRVLKLCVINRWLRPGLSIPRFLPWSIISVIPWSFHSQPLEYISILSYRIGRNKSGCKTTLFELRIHETLQVLLLVGLPLLLTLVECSLNFWNGLWMVSKFSIYFSFQILLMLPFFLLILVHFFCKLVNVDRASSFFRNNNILLLS